MLIGGALLAAAWGSAVSACSVMSHGVHSPLGTGRNRTAREDDGAVTVLVLAVSAVALGSLGAAALSPGGLSVGSLSPFLLPVVLGLGPLVVGARRARGRVERRTEETHRG